MLICCKKKYGMALAIQLKNEEITRRCDSNFKEWDKPKKKILDHKNEEDRKVYLDSIAGDGAAILDGDGQTLAVNAIFQPYALNKIDVEKLVKRGTRHINSQKITMETEQAIIFVVSTDGPITVFHKGEAVFRVL